LASAGQWEGATRGRGSGQVTGVAPMDRLHVWAFVLESTRQLLLSAGCGRLRGPRRDAVCVRGLNGERAASDVGRKAQQNYGVARG